jgi:O-antigen ligase
MAAHNQYLMFMQDHGLLGAAILPLLVLAMTWGVRGEARKLAILFACIVMLQSFASHNIMNQGEVLMLFALMAAISSTSRESEMKKAQAMTTAEAGGPRIFAKT